MITLPHAYAGYDGTYYILGWSGSDYLNLKVKTPSGREWVLRNSDTVVLLESLKLNREDIPGPSEWPLEKVSLMEYVTRKL